MTIPILDAADRQRIILLVGDLGSEPALTDDQIALILSNHTRNGVKNYRAAAAEYCDILASYLADQAPERAQSKLVRARQLRTRVQSLEFEGDSGRTSSSTATGTGLTPEQAEKLALIPDAPPAGERNDKVIKFDGDSTDWEPDATADPGSGISAADAEAIVERYTGQSADTDDFPESKIPDTIARDSELAGERTSRQQGDTALGRRIDGKANSVHTHTEAQVTGLTTELATKADAVDLNALFDGASIQGRVITFTRHNGVDVTVTVPAATGGMADGVVTAGSYDPATQLITLTVQGGTNVEINCNALVNNAELVAAIKVETDARAAAIKTVTDRIAAEETARAAGDKWVSRTASSAAELHNVLTGTSEMALARMIELTDEVDEVHQGITYDHKGNSIGYALPGETAFTFLFSLTNTVLATAVSSAQLAALLVTHVKGHSDLIVYIGAAFTHAGTAFKVGDFVAYAPQSTTADVKFNIPPGAVPDGSITLAKLAKDVTDRLNRYYGKLDIIPNNIPTAADIERGFQVATSDVQVDLISEANELNLWINGKGFHVDDPYTPAATTVFDASVNATEALAIALTEPAQGEIGIVEVLAVFRKDGEFVADIGTYLTIGGAEQGGGGGAVRSFEVETYDLPAKTTAEIRRGQTATMTWTLAEIQTDHPGFTAPSGHYLLDASLSSHTQFSVVAVTWDSATGLTIEVRNESNNNRAFSGITVTLQVLRGATSSDSREVPDGSIDEDKLADQAVTTSKIAPRAVNVGRLSRRLQVAALELVAPSTRPAMSGAYSVSFSDSSVLDSGGYFEVGLNGVSIGDRVAWTQQTSIAVTPDTGELTQMARVSSTSVLVSLIYYADASGGSIISGHTHLVQIVPVVEGVTLTEYTNKAAAEAATVGSNVIQWWPA